VPTWTDRFSPFSSMMCVQKHVSRACLTLKNGRVDPKYGMGLHKTTANETLVSRPDFLEIPCGRAGHHHYSLLWISLSWNANCHNFAQWFTAACTNCTVLGQSNNRYSAYNFVKSTETYPFIEICVPSRKRENGPAAFPVS